MDKSRLQLLKRQLKEDSSKVDQFSCGRVSDMPTAVSITANVGASSIPHLASPGLVLNKGTSPPIANDALVIQHRNPIPSSSSRKAASSTIATIVPESVFSSQHVNDRAVRIDAAYESIPAGDESGFEIAAMAEGLSKQQLSVIWECRECRVECIPVRRESRCLCGHRLKEHSASNTSASSHGKSEQKLKCQATKCSCNNFFFVVAEGAWILRCRCKHKHIEHDCSGKPYLCKRCKPGAAVGCSGFDSPWVCNCGHPWGSHAQSTTIRSHLDAGAQLQDVYMPGASSALRSFAMRQDGLQ